MKVSTHLKQNKILSLRNWPSLRSKSSEVRLTPQTSQIIQNSGILIQEIIPKTLEEFINENKLFKQTSQEVIKLYKQFTDRQNKKVALLKFLKGNNLNIKDKQSQNQLIQSQYLGMSKNSTKDSNKHIIFKKNKSKKSIIGSLTKSKSKKNITKTSKNKQTKQQINSRLDYYGNSSSSLQNQNNISNKFNFKNNNGNTKSQIKIIKKYSFPHDQYNDIDSVIIPMSDIKSNGNQKGQFYKQIANYASKVMEMSQKQNKQMREAQKVFNEKQLKRLRKIHIVEKQRLQQEINKIVKSSNNSKILKQR